ncbi:helix-turn-helix transcriptional regulator [Eggerthella sinensis]|uniref:helix-turn-helix transcriptional regulator n=1 Tax=Eggerthella sinensis TaxID=242230 RepID=UPI00266C17B8|nr:helix-turn-helix transcriptional regulator [Eggerthella sinensis]
MKRIGQATLFNVEYAAVMVGFGLYWAWIDCAFFAPVLYNPVDPSSMPLSLVHLCVIACSLMPPLVVAALRPDAAMQSRTVVLAFAVTGTLCNALLLTCAFFEGVGAVAFAILFGGAGMGLGALAWGCRVASYGAEGASVCIPGTFVASVLVGLLVQALVAEASAVIVAFLPLASCALFMVPFRRHADRDCVAGRMENPESIRVHLSKLFGIIPTHFMVILFLFCAAFGIMQYLLVLLHAESASIIEQNIAVRGFIALVVLIGFGVLSWKPDAAYKIGLLLITAGFLATPFLKSAALSSSIVMAGYTCFDMMGWIIVSALAVKNEDNAAGVIALSRLFELGGVLCGGVVGVLATGWVWSDDANMAIVTTAIAYLLVAAAVLLLYRGTTSVWPLMERPVEGELGLKAGEKAMEALANRYGLTPREKDMLGFFAAGRSIPWIAQHEGISEGTVRSHTRHLYEKANVHSRQELLDIIEDQIVLDDESQWKHS